MSDKSIKISERDILKRFDEMMEESMDPETYSLWKDDIIPKLKQIRDGLKKKPVGMYGDTPRISIGKFTICEQHIPPSETVWIEVEGKEGGEFRKEDFEAVIREFFDKNI